MRHSINVNVFNVTTHHLVCVIESVSQSNLITDRCPEVVPSMVIRRGCLHP